MEPTNESKMQIRNQVFGSLAAGLLSFSVACNVALPSSIISLLIKEGELVQDFETASWLGTVFWFTAIPTSVLGGMISDKFGRRRSALMFSLPLLIGWIVLATATKMEVMIVGRLICGVAVFGAYPSANVLVSEVVHPSVRGSLGIFPSMMLSVGFFAAYLTGYLFTSWRTICWIMSTVSIVIFVSMYLVKESPYWLIQNGRKVEALDSLVWYRGGEFDISDEFNEIVQKKEEKQDDGLKEKMKDVFSLPFLRAFAISGGLFFIVQFNGISILAMFMTEIFQDAKLSFDPRLAPVLIGLIRILSVGVSCFVMAKGNRKLLICSCLSILGLCNLGMALLDMYRSSTGTDSWLMGFLPFPLIVVMFMAHAFGINNIIHLTTSEVYPTSVRSIGNGLTASFSTIGATISAALYPIMLKWSGTQGVFFSFAGFSIVACIYAAIVMPDNRGLSLTNIERVMSEKKKLPPKSDVEKC